MNSHLTILAKELGKLLLQKSQRLVTVESCTGGGLSYFLTEVPGSSQWFERGLVTYSNDAKTTLLHANLHDGAVSESCVISMAEGGLKNSHADISIAITGIAGPDGGSKEKPIGTVWFALAAKDKPTQTQLKQFTGDRHTIRLQAIEFALQSLIQHHK